MIIATLLCSVYALLHNGEVQILPDLDKNEVAAGHVEGVEVEGGFVFDLDWENNTLTHLKLTSRQGGWVRLKTNAGLSSPLLEKPRKIVRNPVLAATVVKDHDAKTCGVRSMYEDARAKSIRIHGYDLFTEKGETFDFRTTTGNQDWPDFCVAMSEDDLKNDEGKRIAENVLDYQLETGGWPKNKPMQDRLSPREREVVRSWKSHYIDGTIDNGATLTEIRFMAKMYAIHRDPRYLASVEKAIDFLLSLQYPSGGFSQCDRRKIGYWDRVTFNDGAMIGAMAVMRDIAKGDEPFDFEMSAEKREQCRASFLKGIEFILKAQIVQNGVKTVWCQQHDPVTYAPLGGRAFELAALTSGESNPIVRMLMSVEDPGEEIIDACRKAADWYERSVMTGYKLGECTLPSGATGPCLVKTDDPGDRLWARFYTLEDNRPFTADRQGEKIFNFDAQLRGDEMSYRWFMPHEDRLIRDVRKWAYGLEKKTAEEVKAKERAKREFEKTVHSIKKNSKRLARSMIDSEVKRHPDPRTIDGNVKPKWNYTHGLELQAMLVCAKEWPELGKTVKPYVKKFLDTMIEPDGRIVAYDPKAKKLDCLNPGKMVFLAKEVWPEDKRLDKAIEEMYSQLLVQPRTKEGGFWHKQIYPHQMWLDGVYMAMPFYARCAGGKVRGCEGEKVRDIVNQFRVIANHTYDKETGLFRHGWDESKKQKWADKATGRSARAWGRAQGWFIAAIVETLENLSICRFVDSSNENVEFLKKLLNEYAVNLVKFQAESGAWYQVADEPGREGNYEEATATALIAYAMLKAWNCGWIQDESVRDAGLKGVCALVNKFRREDEDGVQHLTQCCRVAGLGPGRPGTFEYYLSEPVGEDDAKGVGPYLMALVELSRMSEDKVRRPRTER